MFIWFTDNNIFTVAMLKISQNNRLRTRSNKEEKTLEENAFFAQERRSRMTLDSGNIRLLFGYLQRFPGDGVSNKNGIIENVDFRASGR